MTVQFNSDSPILDGQIDLKYPIFENECGIVHSILDQGHWSSAASLEDERTCNIFGCQFLMILVS